MPLATSGELSLGDIHVEASGSGYAFSGTSSLNDADIRGLTPASGYTINATPGTTISIGDFYGASAASTYSLVQGTAGTSIKGYSAGFGTASAISGSSLTPNTLNSVTIKALYYFEYVIKGSYTRQLFMVLDGNRASNFFATISETSLPNQPLTSGNATRSYNSQYNYTSYTWNLPSAPSNWDGSGTLTVNVT